MRRLVNITTISFIFIISYLFGSCYVSSSNYINELSSKNKQFEKQLQTANKNIDKLNSIKDLPLITPKEEIKIKTAYLTFDDAPSQNTSKILKILMDNKIKATFFVNIKNKDLSLIKLISLQGHQVSNHSYSHDYEYIYNNKDNFISDTEKAQQEIDKITGKKNIKLYRFPGGSNNGYIYKKDNKTKAIEYINELKKKGYTYTDWTITGGDSESKAKTAEEIMIYTLDQIEKQDVINILLHDTNTKKSTVEALPIIIKRLKILGYEFKLLDNEADYNHFVE
jgi:peptidoglycan/xylan/chitin deacetylase (PgdA/CDA1 family)